MGPDRQEQRGLKKMWRARKERRRERMLAKAERLSHRHKIDEGPEAYEQAIRSVPTSAGVRSPSRWAIQDSNLGPLPYQRSALTD
jgi:hypothetical protein